MRDLSEYRDAFQRFMPWKGHVPQGFVADYWGILTNIKFRPLNPPPGVAQALEAPNLGQGKNGEGWFEAINWLSAARDARERFVMISLGAHYGAQLVGCHRMLQLVNPLPCMLVAVEAEPQNFSWITNHMQDNGIDPSAHWLIPMAVSDSNEPVLFPVGGAGVGSNNCFATNIANSRRIYADLIIRDGDPNEALRNIFVNGSTGFTQPVHPDLEEYMTEVKFVSAVTLSDLLGPFEVVDLLEADIQQSEISVFPPFIALLRRKVRRILIGTHGAEEHRLLHRLFEEDGWVTVFDYAPNSLHSCSLGDFELNDGVLTVRNPDL
jgi:FkbM family methyltransferase